MILFKNLLRSLSHWNVTENLSSFDKVVSSGIAASILDSNIHLRVYISDEWCLLLWCKYSDVSDCVLLYTCVNLTDIFPVIWLTTMSPWLRGVKFLRMISCCVAFFMHWDGEGAHHSRYIIITMSVPFVSAVVCFLFAIFCHVAKPDGQKQDDKKPKKAAKSLKVLDPKAGQNLCK